MSETRTLLLSHSARMFWNQCHRKYYWSNVLDLEPKMTPKPFVRGKLGHTLTDIVAKNEKPLSQVLGEVEVQDQELAKAMQLYFDKEARGDKRDFAPLRYKRHAFSFDIPLCQIEHYIVRYVGELDGIVEWDNEDWVLERKFTTRVPSDMVGQFQLDDQSRGYAWAMHQKNIPVAGVIPDIIRCTKYPDTVRELIRIDASDREAFMLDAIEIAEEIIEGITKNRFPMSPHTCNLMGECPYKTLCVNPDRARFALSMGYNRRTISHEEEVSGRASDAS